VDPNLICHLSDSEWPKKHDAPAFSFDLFSTLLAIMHPFTVIGFNTQAFLYSCGDLVAIKYIALLPERHDEATEQEALKVLHEKDLTARNLVYRGCINIRPQGNAILTVRDIYDL